MQERKSQVSLVCSPSEMVVRMIVSVAIHIYFANVTHDQNCIRRDGPFLLVLSTESYFIILALWISSAMEPLLLLSMLPAPYSVEF